MRKLQGSLGFTLRKEDDSALGHYIRALVREPALTDSRIRAGDKIIAVSLPDPLDFLPSANFLLPILAYNAGGRPSRYSTITRSKIL